MRRSDLTKSRFSFSKKAFSAFVSLVMLIAMIPTSALAVDDPVSYPEQVVTQGGTTSPNNGEDGVTMKESISYVTDGNGDRIENLFDVTIDVKTPKRVEEIDISPNAGVSLVLDLSGSMEDNFDGKKKLDSMKTAVNKFLDGYATGDTGVIRNVSIVVFASHGAALSGWVDVNQGTNLADLKAKVSALTIGTGGATINGHKIQRNTNLTAGLMLSKNLISDLITADGDNYASATEGKYNIFNIAFTDGDANYSTSGNSISLTYIVGDSSSYNVARAQAQGIAINDLGATTMAVAYGDATLDVYGYCNGETYSAKNSNQLELAFENFNYFIEMTTKLWTVELPFAAPVEYVGVVNEDGTTTNTAIKDNVFSWDLTKDIPVFANNEYTYTKTIRVSLNTLSSAFVKGTSYDATVKQVTENNVVTTNGSVLYYTPYNKDAGKYEEIAKVGEFVVPTVKGFADDVSFKKVDDKGTAVSGLSFTLKKGDYTQTVVSGANGVVTFTNVPSGHDFVITEDGFGTGEANEAFAGTYERNTTPINVSVAWGGAAITSGLDANDEYVNNRVKNITVKVNYYKDNVTNTGDAATYLGTATFTQKFLPGDKITLAAGTAATQLNHKQPNYYKDGVQQGGATYTVTGSNDVINVLYLAEEYSVIVNYYKDNVTNTSDAATYLGTATFTQQYKAGDKITLAAGTAATQLNHKQPNYYKDGVQQGGEYTVTGSNDVINVLYVADEFPVIVNYYKDAVTNPGDANFLGTFTLADQYAYGDEITLAGGTNGGQLDYLLPDYYLTGEQQGDVPYVVTSDGDVINVLYVKGTFPVIVNYYKDAVTNPGDANFLGTFTLADQYAYGDEITLAGGTNGGQLDYLLPDYYLTGEQQGGIPYVVTSDGDVINVLYVGGEIIIPDDEPPLYIPDDEPPLTIPDETPPLTGDSSSASFLAFALITSAFAAGFVWKKKAKKDS